MARFIKFGNSEKRDAMINTACTRDISWERIVKHLYSAYSSAETEIEKLNTALQFQESIYKSQLASLEKQLERMTLLVENKWETL